MTEARAATPGGLGTRVVVEANALDTLFDTLTVALAGTLWHSLALLRTVLARSMKVIVPSGSRATPP